MCSWRTGQAVSDVGSTLIRHARMRLDPRPGLPRQGRGANPRAARGFGRSTATRGRHPWRRLPLKNNTDSAATPTVPREIPTSRRRRLRPLCRGPDPVLVSPNLTPVREGPPDAEAPCTASASGPRQSGRCVRRRRPRRRSSTPGTNPTPTPSSYRRLHVIVGDSNMSEYATFLKVGASSILLRMLEDPAVGA